MRILTHSWIRVSDMRRKCKLWIPMPYSGIRGEGQISEFVLRNHTHAPVMNARFSDCRLRRWPWDVIMMGGDMVTRWICIIIVVPGEGEGEEEEDLKLNPPLLPALVAAKRRVPAAVAEAEAPRKKNTDSPPKTSSSEARRTPVANPSSPTKRSSRIRSSR